LWLQPSRFLVVSISDLTSGKLFNRSAYGCHGHLVARSQSNVMTAHFARGPVKGKEELDTCGGKLPDICKRNRYALPKHLPVVVPVPFSFPVLKES